MGDAALQFLSPPVVQQATRDGFAVSIEVNRLCTGHVEWGFAADALSHRARAADYGLIDASDRCLVIPVRFPAALESGRAVFYRVCAQSLDYKTAYEISRGDPVETASFDLQIPSVDERRVRLAVINDTHENVDVISALEPRVDALAPDVLVWNGDACRSYDEPAELADLLLRPGAKGGWASTRPLLFTCGNHDVRGAHARLLPETLAPGPYPGLPWNVAHRFGPLAVLSLDAGEDKPDHHPAFAGTAAYEPYRERQALWLREQLARPEIADAPFKIVFCHIPLRGLPGQNDGSTLIDHARYSGHGSELWMPSLIEAGVHAVVSGHTHEWRIDAPSDEQPVTQVVGGGPSESAATVIVIEATATELSIGIQDLSGATLAEQAWNSSAV